MRERIGEYFSEVETTQEYHGYFYNVGEALTLLRAAPDHRLSGRKRKMSGPKKRFSAAMRPSYMFTVLFGK